MLTGLRRDELRTLRWNAVDQERGVIVLVDTKTGGRTVPICAPVREILATLPRIDGNAHVFPGRSYEKPLRNIAKPWARIVALAGIAAARPHDLRHTAASLAVAGGASLELIGGLLGHRSPLTTKRYTHLGDSPVRATADMIGRQIDAAMKGDAADVVPFAVPKRSA